MAGVGKKGRLTSWKGIGSTEMLHMFISARPGDVRSVRPGSRFPLQLRLVDEQGAPVGRGEIGELQVSGPTARRATEQSEKSRSNLSRVFRSGDIPAGQDGYFVYACPLRDMLRVSGFNVSPLRSKRPLVSHEAVLEAAVVGHEDDNRLIKRRRLSCQQASRRANPQDDHAAAHQGQARAL